MLKHPVVFNDGIESLPRRRLEDDLLARPADVQHLVEEQLGMIVAALEGAGVVRAPRPFARLLGLGHLATGHVERHRIPGQVA
jgi:hypothetical protein